MYIRKPTPTTQYEISTGAPNKQFNRANEVRRDNDAYQELSIGLFDLDFAIKYYFDEVLQPTVIEAGNIQKIPVMYGSPEKWKNMQADGYFRDINGKIQSPLISYKRSTVTKNKTMGSKVDGNYPQAYYTQEVTNSEASKYDQFSVLTNNANKKPTKTFINTIIPDYVDVSYDVIIWTDYLESMNKIVESLIYTEGSYWGEQERFKFRSKIDSFTNITDLLQDVDRVVRTTFTLTLFGYIVPDTLAKNLAKALASKTTSRSPDTTATTE